LKEHRVVIRQTADLEASVREIFEYFGWKDLKTRKVLVKPNMLRAACPEECVVTDPRLVEETVSYLFGAGAEIMVGDNPMPDTRFPNVTDVADYCGFVRASKGTFRNIGRYTRKVKRPKSLLGEFYVSREVLDCDLLVSLPKYKSHELMTMSIAVKNQYGIIPGGLKPYIHSLFPGIEDFSKILVEVYEIRTPDIIIVDCIDVVDAKGRRHQPGVVIAGDNGHAVDFACALMAGIDPFRVPTIKTARSAGLFDPKMISYTGELRDIKGFSLPLVFPFRSAVVESVARILYRIWLARIPVIDRAACTQCLSCENVCPPRAIKQQHIDYDQCIKCYCCVEVCPQGAIRNKSKLLVRR
jgi:uncharacterized protein (DUF362 family)/NAD-dependent dihydropyrimidine dehydrogenase PreA subunit